MKGLKLNQILSWSRYNKNTPSFFIFRFICFVERIGGIGAFTKNLLIKSYGVKLFCFQFL